MRRKSSRWLSVHLRPAYFTRAAVFRCQIPVGGQKLFIPFLPGNCLTAWNPSFITGPACFFQTMQPLTDFYSVYASLGIPERHFRQLSAGSLIIRRFSSLAPGRKNATRRGPFGDGFFAEGQSLELRTLFDRAIFFLEKCDGLDPFFPRSWPAVCFIQSTKWCTAGGLSTRLFPLYILMQNFRLVHIRCGGSSRSG